jgi:hypothetical protein
METHKHTTGLRHLISHRNDVRQVVKLKDGSEKIVWHDKKFNNPVYGDYKSFWNHQNKAPKPNSKRQRKLKESMISV